MNNVESIEKDVTESVDERKPWVSPSATVEQVSDATRITGGGTGDGVSCHS